MAALLPATAVAAVALLMLRTGSGFQDRVARPLAQQTEADFMRALTADADRLDERLSRASMQARTLAAYTAEVLKAPAAYTPHAPAAAAKPGMPPPKAVENPVYYVRGSDGALRKPVDDGQSAVFFGARQAPENFTEYENQQLYATAVLDPLLVNATKSDELIASAYVATKRGLIRMYPWADLQSWPGNLNPFTKLTMCAYSKEKAGSDGVVWTKPYESKITRQVSGADGKKEELAGAWAVACVAPIIVDGKVVGVAGCELDLAQLRQALAGSEDTASMLHWLAHPDGMVLTAQDGAVAKLGATPISDTELASTGNAEDKAFQAAQPKGATSVLAEHWLNLSAGNVQQVDDAEMLSLVGKVTLPRTGWVLGGTAEAPALTAARRYIFSSATAQLPAMVTMIICLIAGALLMLALAGLETRRVFRPLAILAAQVRSVVSSGVATSVVIDTNSELGDMSQAVQELVDFACLAATERRISAEEPPLESNPDAAGSHRPAAEPPPNLLSDDAPVIKG